MPFFTFAQRRACPGMIYSDKLTLYVIIEAPSAIEANLIARSVGIDFKLPRCKCCPSRWSPRPHFHAGDPTPLIMGNAVVGGVYARIPGTTRPTDLLMPGAYIYYLDGRKESAFPLSGSYI